MITKRYPIGTPGQKWGNAERDAWRFRQLRQRRYNKDIVPRIEALGDRYRKIEYGQINYAGDKYTLLALHSRRFNPTLPSAVVTGGVHGYETSGVLGALAFIETRADAFIDKINLLVIPCVSPWAYEHISRWNYDAIDPNRHFFSDSPAQEAAALMKLAALADRNFLLHIDLHETTDSDESEFRPALAARDGKTYDPSDIADGFYVVADSDQPQLAFQNSIIAAVERVTHIAQPDEAGNIIGSPVISRGVIEYPLAKLGLCASLTSARYTSTTEVYPDSPKTTPEVCIRAQVEAICAALSYALEHRQ